MPDLVGAKYCKIHKFITYSDVEFSQHLGQFKHYTLGDKTFCVNCKEKIEGFLVPISTLGQSVYIICDKCKKKLDYALETIGYQKGDKLDIPKLSK